MQAKIAKVRKPNPQQRNKMYRNVQKTGTHVCIYNINICVQCEVDGDGEKKKGW